VRAVPRLCELYPGICLTTEGKAGKTSARVTKYKNNEQYNTQKKNTRVTESASWCLCVCKGVRGVLRKCANALPKELMN
jgi:hypothetical protein